MILLLKDFINAFIFKGTFMSAFLLKDLGTMVHEEEEVSLESLAGMFEFFGDVKTKLTKAVTGMVENPVYAINTAVVDKVDVERAVAKLPDDWKEVDGFIPNKLDDYLANYAITLTGQLKVYSDIVERLYDPLIDWTGKTISIDGAANKVWMDPRLKTQNVDKARKQLAKHFDRKKIPAGGDPNRTTLGEMFASPKQIVTTRVLLAQLHEATLGVNMDAIKEREKLLVDLMDAFSNKLAQTERVDIPKANIEKLAMTLRAVARETEYLAALVFNATVLIVAYNDTVKAV